MHLRLTSALFLRLLLCCAYAAGDGAPAGASAAATFESMISQVTQEVQAKYGANMTILEALACGDQLCVQGNASMHRANDAHFMRVVYTAGAHYTAPNVVATVCINMGSSPAVNLTYHTDAFTQDNFTEGFPPASNITFESAWAVVAKVVPNARFTQVTWRRPLHPCVSEDLFQFQFDRLVEQQWPLMSVGASSGKACFGFVTNPVQSKFCSEPEFQPKCRTSLPYALSPVVV